MVPPVRANREMITEAEVDASSADVPNVSI